VLRFRGRSPYELWRDARQQFDLYQSVQKIGDRKKLSAPYWASFVGTLSNETMFVGLYRVRYQGLLKQDTRRPHMDGVDKAGRYNVYALAFEPALNDLIGKLFINWGLGTRSWIQYADRQNKQVTELRAEFKEPDFPGFLNFIQPLSKLITLPKSWKTTLQSSRGVYLLTCPKTKGTVRRLSDRREGLLGSLASLCSNEPRRK
jgi:hypothetical protein